MKKEQGVRYLSYPQAVFVVCSYDYQKRPNLMTVALGGMCSHNPPLLFVSIKKTRYTHRNITERRAFTVNVPSSDHVAQVDYVGLVSGRTADKYAVCGLTAVPSDAVDAPFIEEFPTHAECVLYDAIELGSHTMFIGEIKKIMGDEDITTDLSHMRPNANNIPDMIKARGIVYAVAGDSRCYCSLGTPLEKAYSAGRKFKA